MIVCNSTLGSHIISFPIDIFTKWGVHLVIAKEIMALITTAPLGVRLQAFLEQHVSPSSQWPCFL